MLEFHNYITFYPICVHHCITSTLFVSVHWEVCLNTSSLTTLESGGGDMDRPGYSAAVLTVCPLRQCQCRAMLEGIWLVAFPPEISACKSVATGP